MGVKVEDSELGSRMTLHLIEQSMKFTMPG